jgi:pantothenate kinase-related protein Tda10
MGPCACICVSLDDFYLEPAVRRARGFARRGPPGTHDTVLLDAFLAQVRSADLSIAVPAFDRDLERRLPAVVRTFAPTAPLRLCILEGWFVGARAPGYEALADAIDWLIYLDMDAGLARAARLDREERLRRAGRAVMSAEEVARFWDEALAPQFAAWVYPLRERADVVVRLSAQHTIQDVSVRRMP